ncbi:Hypothetical_protein [Hexamita inflata]|uniref:Hypothetical_protein n=1 Tax=Hexamita inflata TaxID=28002 RepID=A0AA86PA43_9EUKA|nr:Hypothetical protein HINF_LOCUS22527 [Hexamita inflata]
MQTELVAPANPQAVSQTHVPDAEYMLPSPYLDEHVTQESLSELGTIFVHSEQIIFQRTVFPRQTAHAVSDTTYPSLLQSVQILLAAPAYPCAHLQPLAPSHQDPWLYRVIHSVVLDAPFIVMYLTHFPSMSFSLKSSHFRAHFVLFWFKQNSHTQKLPSLLKVKFSGQFF